MTNKDYYQNTQGKPFQLALGDLVQMASERRFDVIGHGCNCMHQNDAGISLAIAQRFPAAELADLATPSKDPAKLGTFTQAHIPELDPVVPIIYKQFKKAGYLSKFNVRPKIGVLLGCR